MSGFLSSLLSPEGCTVDGSIGANPFTGAVEQMFDQMEMFSSNQPYAFYPDNQYDASYDQSSNVIISDENIHGPSTDQSQNAFFPQATNAFHDNIHGHMFNNVQQNFSPPYPSFYPAPLMMPIMNPTYYPQPNVMQIHSNYIIEGNIFRGEANVHNSQREFTPSLSTQSQIPDSNMVGELKQNKRVSILESFDGALSSGRGVSNDQVKELLSQFEEFQTDESVTKAGHEAAWQRTLDNLTKMDDQYIFQQHNQYLEQIINVDADTRSENYQKLFEQGMQSYREGNIAEAIKAFEAAIKVDPETSDAWNMLGTCHTENDDDKIAIICFKKSLENDQYHLNSLLSLGICYVNESDPTKALEHLKSWVTHNPMFHGLSVPMDEYSDGSFMDEVVQLMEAVGRLAPDDKEVNLVLGVLYNVTADYKRAEERFLGALDPNSTSEYSIYNKIGATLANSNNSVSAIPYYVKSLQARPRYARGWLNLGISYANLGRYEESIKAYIRALSINGNAHHIWGFLRVSLTYLDRFDLVEFTNKRDLATLASKLNIEL